MWDGHGKGVRRFLGEMVDLKPESRSVLIDYDLRGNSKFHHKRITIVYRLLASYVTTRLSRSCNTRCLVALTTAIPRALARAEAKASDTLLLLPSYRTLTRGFS